MVAVPGSLVLRAVVIFFLLFGLPALFAPQKLMNVILKFMKSDEAMLSGGFIILIFAFLCFMGRYALTGVRSIIFVILGILSLIKGVMMIRFPKFGGKRGTAVYKKKALVMIVGAFLVLFSALFVFTAAIK